MMSTRSGLAAALCLLCLAGALRASVATVGAPYIPNIFTNAFTRGGFFYCISAGRDAMPATGRQAVLEDCDITAGSPMVMTFKNMLVTPDVYPGYCLDQVPGPKASSPAQAFFKPCNGADTQMWMMDKLGRLINEASGLAVNSANAASRNPPFSRKGDKLIVEAVAAPGTISGSGALTLVSPTQTWFWHDRSESGYKGPIFNQFPGSNGELLCLDNMGSSDTAPVNAQLKPCEAGKASQQFQAEAVNVTLVKLGIIARYKLSTGTQFKGFPLGNFRLKALDADGNVLKVNGKEQCLAVACNARNCGVSILDGTKQANMGDPNYQILVRACSPVTALTAPCTAITCPIVAPGPRDVFTLNNHGNILGFFYTFSAKNNICIGTERNTTKLTASDCSFRHIGNNWIWNQPA